MTRLEIARPAGFVHRATDYMFARIPEIAKHEWHPFTISSAPQRELLGLHIRNLASVLESLALHANQGKQPGSLEQVHFSWINREQRGFEWFRELLASVERMDTGTLLDIRPQSAHAHGPSGLGLLLRPAGTRAQSPNGVLEARPRVPSGTFLSSISTRSVATRACARRAPRRWQRTPRS